MAGRLAFLQRNVEQDSPGRVRSCPIGGSQTASPKPVPNRIFPTQVYGDGGPGVAQVCQRSRFRDAARCRRPSDEQVNVPLAKSGQGWSSVGTAGCEALSGPARPTPRLILLL